MPNSTRPPPRDPLAETWPDDPHGLGMTDKQIDYVARMIERIESQVPSAEDLAYLRRKREEDEHIGHVKRYLREHWPRLAFAASVAAAIVTGVVKGLAWFATHRITITNQ